MGQTSTAGLPHRAAGRLHLWNSRPPIYLDDPKDCSLSPRLTSPGTPAVPPMSPLMSFHQASSGCAFRNASRCTAYPERIQVSIGMGSQGAGTGSTRWSPIHSLPAGPQGPGSGAQAASPQSQAGTACTTAHGERLPQPAQSCCMLTWYVVSAEHRSDIMLPLCRWSLSRWRCQPQPTK